MELLAGLVAITAEPLTPGPILRYVYWIDGSDYNVFWNKILGK